MPSAANATAAGQSKPEKAPLAVTADALDPDARPIAIRVDGVERAHGVFSGFDWVAAVSLAADGTRLYPGDLIAGPGSALVDGVSPGSRVDLEVDGIGVLEQKIAS